MTATLQAHETFESFPYKRPEISILRTEFEQHLANFEQATSLETQIESLRRLNDLREEFSTMYNLCYVRHTVNTADPFYEKENDFFDENLPLYEELNNHFYQVIQKSRFLPQLQERFGKQFFVLVELALKTFQPVILEELQQENGLISEYIKLKSKARVELDGQSLNLPGLQPFEVADDRETRRRAAETKWAFYAEHAEQSESIFDKMVHLRHEMAQKLGYRNFVAMGYDRMRRSDYTPEMVANFRKQVRELIVPLAGELYRRQSRRLGLDRLKYYDEEYKFPTGNPKPVGNPEEIVAAAASMYSELSPETDRFFRFLQDTRLMDLVNRDNKFPSGYCTYLSKFKSPFIFSNFTGTSGDIDVLTHEAGHAFQVWSSDHFEFDEYLWPTNDAAEIHSMSMEFFTWPWMRRFFEGDTEKYYFMHLGNALLFLPYGVAVDEFQHIIYEHPDMTPAERNAAWRRLENIYLPHRDYDGNTFLENGGFWQKQNHIFNSPFYYIDYALAQICAFQFWTKDRRNHDTAWKDYLRLCQAGGSRSFLDLVRLADLRSPFEDGCVASVVGEIRRYLDSVDDSDF